MTLTVPLTVRLRTSRRDSDITAQLRDLEFRSAIPGGYASCTMSLNRPLDIQPGEIDYYAGVFVYDGRSGITVWEGRLEDPGRTAGDAGEVWSLAAVGPAAHASDQAVALIYVDTDQSRWVRSKYATSNGLTETGEVDQDTPALVLRANESATIALTWIADFIYRPLMDTGQKLARVQTDHIEGVSSSLYQVGMYNRIDSAGSPGPTDTDNWSTTAGSMAATYGSSNWVDGQNVVSLRAFRQTSTTGAAVDVYSQMYHVVVRAALLNADGSALTTSLYTVATVSPAEVVADLLGRILTKFDGANASINSSGVGIAQLAYPDPVTPAQILDDLAVFDPAYYWAAWETNPVTGRYRFEYKPWPTTVRYEASADDGFDSPGSAVDLYNSVIVRWTDAQGRIRNTVRTSAVQQLTDAGLTRQAFIDMSNELGTAVTAQRAGDNFLAEHAHPPNAGTLTVARPLLDNVTGRMVQPWEIVPGYLIRVQGVLPRVDALNPTSRDGVTVFKVVSATYSAANAAATLELDSYSRTVAQQLSGLKNTRLRKR